MKESQLIRKPVSNRTPLLLIDKLPLLPIFALLGSRISTGSLVMLDHVAAAAAALLSSLLEW